MENSIIEASYPIDFRGNIALQLGQYLKSRQSVVLIGMKRVGISNFLRFFIHHNNIIKTYISSSEKHLFVPIDLNDMVELEIHPFWILTLKRLVDVMQNTNLDKETRHRIDLLFLDSIQSQDLFLTLDSIRSCLRLIVDKGFLPTLFYIRFDRMRNTVTQDFFANLQSLKDSSGQKLSYVFTSFRSLDVVAPLVFSKTSLSVFSKDLYIKPTELKDTQVIFNSYIKKYKLSLTESLKNGLFEVVDGYVQYLQLSLIILHELKALPGSKKELLEILLKDERVGLQSEELWESLEENEKNVLTKIVKQEKISKDDRQNAKYIFDTGFVTQDSEKIKTFSPLFEDYVLRQNQKSSDGSSNEFSKKENLLFKFLSDNLGNVCEREGIVEAVWPEAEALGISDWAIDRLISRLRSKLKTKNFKFEIQTIKTRGYKLIASS